MRRETKVFRARMVTLGITTLGYGAVVAGLIMSPLAVGVAVGGFVALFFAHSMHGEIERIVGERP